MARTLHDWAVSLARQLRDAPGDLRRAVDSELSRGVAELRRSAPRRRSGASAREPLARSIRVDQERDRIYTDHPGANLLEHGGTVRARSGFLAVPIRRGAFGGLRGYSLRPLSGGWAVVSGARIGRLEALLLRSVRIRGTRWISRANEETVRDSEQRLARALLPEEP